MRLSNAKFLDYTVYNQNQYANAANHYEDNFIISGLTISTTRNELSPGEIFLNGWHLTFADTLPLGSTSNPYICVSYTSTLGNAVEGLYETSYTKGRLTASITQTASPTGYVLYRYTGGKWVLQSNGRIDTVNGKKANLSNALTIDGSDIMVTNPIFDTPTVLNTTLADINTRIDELTGGGLTVTVANKTFHNMFNIDEYFTPTQIKSLNMARFVKLIGDTIPVTQPTLAYGNTFGNRDYADVLKALISLYYPHNLGTEYFNYTIEYNSYPSDLSNGGTILSIIPNNSARKYEFLIDNFGTNVGTNNADTFQPLQVHTTYLEVNGSTNITGKLSAGEGNFEVNATGTSLALPSDFLFYVPGASGSQTIKFNEKVRIGEHLNVGDKFFAYSDGSMTSHKMLTRQIEFENCTGTSGTKNIVLNHDNGALGGLLEWSRKTNGANSVGFTLISKTEGLTYVGIITRENQRLYNYSTGKYVMEASTYLAREELLINELIDSQIQLDAITEKQALQEAQINALIAGETVPTTLSKKLRSNGKLAELKQRLADNQEAQYEEEYANRVEKLDNQIENLKTSLVAVNVRSKVEPSLLSLNDVLAKAQNERAALEEAYNKGEQL